MIDNINKLEDDNVINFLNTNALHTKKIPKTIPFEKKNRYMDIITHIGTLCDRPSSRTSRRPSLAQYLIDAEGNGSLPQESLAKWKSFLNNCIQIMKAKKEKFGPKLNPLFGDSGVSQHSLESLYGDLDISQTNKGLKLSDFHQMVISIKDSIIECDEADENLTVELSKTETSKKDETQKNAGIESLKKSYRSLRSNFIHFADRVLALGMMQSIQKAHLKAITSDLEAKITPKSNVGDKDTTEKEILGLIREYGIKIFKEMEKDSHPSFIKARDYLASYPPTLVSLRRMTGDGLLNYMFGGSTKKLRTKAKSTLEPQELAGKIPWQQCLSSKVKEGQIERFQEYSDESLLTLDNQGVPHSIGKPLYRFSYINTSDDPKIKIRDKGSDGKNKRLPSTPRKEDTGFHAQSAIKRKNKKKLIKYIFVIDREKYPKGVEKKVQGSMGFRRRLYKF